MALTDDLRKSLELAVFEGHGPEPSNVVNIGLERLARRPETTSVKDVTPEDLLSLCLRHVQEQGNITKCYVTLVADNPDNMVCTNYRANMSRTEEISFRQLGVYEAMERWTGGDDG